MLHIRILDRTLAGGYALHTVCYSWQAAIATWFDGQEPMRIHIKQSGLIEVYRG